MEQQIIPQYDFPHEEVYLTDNSGGELDDFSTPEVYYTYLAVFAGPKGPDRVITKIPNLKTHKKVYGKTNHKKYGQPHMMPEAYFQNERSVVYDFRVTADNATYANSILSLWYKIDKDKKKFYVKLTAKPIKQEKESTNKPDTNPTEPTPPITDNGEGEVELFSLRNNREAAAPDSTIDDIISDRESIIQYGLETLDGVAVDGVYVNEEGFTQVPIMAFIANGRGSYGNNYRWRISPNISYEKEYEMKLFTFEIIDTQEANIPYSKTASIVSSGRYNTSYFINDIMEDHNVEQIFTYIHVYEDNIEKIYDAYVEFCHEMMVEDPTLNITIPSLDCFDPLFGKDVAKDGDRVVKNQPFISCVSTLTDDVDTSASGFDANEYTTSKDVVSLNGVAGISLSNGSDGDFDSPDPTIRQNAINNAYIKAFNGTFDKFILSNGRIPLTRMYDANYELPVKLELAKLAITRQSAFLYLDTNLKDVIGESAIRMVQKDFAPIYDMIDEYCNVSGVWLASVNTHYYYIRESSTGKRVPVTSTYYLAMTDASHVINNGSTTPRTNELAQLSGHLKNSLHPSIEEYQKDLKQSLFTARINYFEAVTDNVFERATQNTMVTDKHSDLLHESNAIALLEWINILRAEARKNRVRITDPTKRASFRNYLLEKYEYLKTSHFSTMDITYTANAYEQARNITHLRTSVTFPGINMVMIIEVDVNRREYQEDIEDDES